MSRYINADKLQERIYKRVNNPAIRGWLNALINEELTADVSEVVRCRNCKFYEIAEYDNGTKNVCRLLTRQMQENDFCSYGGLKDV